MGRQLPLATTPADALLLVTAIHDFSPCRLFMHHAATPDDLWIEAWDVDTLGGAGSFMIWPTGFHWTPRFSQTGGPHCPANERGFWYIANNQTAPVLEFTGSDLSAKRYGRLYWAKDFAAPEGLAYDVPAFSQLVDRVFGWIRKVGRKLPGNKYSPYYLPDAWRQTCR